MALPKLFKHISLAWTADFDLLEQFVNDILMLDGVWSQPGGYRKVFTFGDSTIVWRKNRNLLSFTGGKPNDIKKRDMSTDVCERLDKACFANTTAIGYSAELLCRDD